ncbi:recombinase family protein [Endozoicomonas sp.]|uniref:recombinase family protein n=1 Tax=Endozoicomonas sp. TaxID=1892382 RepID=UPI00383A7E5B
MARTKNKTTLVKKRCAIYTRKSSEEGLEQEFNSLHAQRDAGEAYIHSQKHEGWVLVPDDYDDGGFSGGNVERPALQHWGLGAHPERLYETIPHALDRAEGAFQKARTGSP